MSVDVCSAYGLNLVGLGAPADLLGPPLPDAPTITCRWHLETSVPAPDDIRTTITPDHAVVEHPAGVRIELDRVRRTATFVGRAVAPDMRAHPVLSPVALIHNRWLGLEAFHGGVVLVDGRAWVVSGRREAGKSTLLAALAARGHPVLADDIAATDGTVVHRGPRCVDLREEPPLRLTGLLRDARGDSRRRLTLPDAPAEAPLGGWVLLRWSDRPDDRASVTPAAAPDALRALAAKRMIKELETDEGVLLDAAQRPVLVFARPREWSTIDAATDLLLERIRASRSSPTAPGR